MSKSMIGRKAFALALGVLVAVPASAAAQAQTFGSPLTAEPNLGEFIRCENRPFFDASTGNRFLGASGTADCTWRQQGVFGNTSDPRHASVPGDGRIIGVEVVSGSNPAPLRFVVMSQLVSQSNPGNTSCCHFVTETVGTFQPTPNTRSAFPLDLPVQRNTVGDLRRFDIVGLSAASGTGTLPLHSTGQNNAGSYTQAGSVNAGNFYPRVSPADGQSPRYEDGMAGVEVLAQWTWCPAGQTCGATGGGPGTGGPGPDPGTGGGGGPGASPAPAFDGGAARSANGRALVALACGADAACAGALGLVTRGTGARVVRASYGTATYEIPAGGEATIRVKLSRKAKKVLKKKGKLKADLVLTPSGGAATSTPLTIKD